MKHNELLPERMLQIIQSEEFKVCYNYFLNQPKDIVTSYQESHGIFYTYAELEGSYRDWLWLYSRLQYKIDRAAFSPAWLPICDGYDFFIDLNKPEWPLFDMWGCGMWDWELRLHTLSIRALQQPLGLIEKYVLNDTYRASLIKLPGHSKASYFDFLLKNHFKLERNWQLFKPSVFTSYEDNFKDKGVISGLYPYQLNRLPKQMKIEVTKLVFNTWYTAFAFDEYLDNVKTVDHLIYLLNIGLWREIDHLEFVSSDLITYRLKSIRKVGLSMKRLIDKTTWKLEFWPYNEEIKKCFDNRVEYGDSPF